MTESEYFVMFANCTALLLEGINLLIGVGEVMTAYS